MSGKNTMDQENSGPNNSNSTIKVEQLAQCLQDLLLPVTIVTRIMHKTLPMHATVNDDVVEAIQKIVSYFIHRITIKANEYCHMDKRKIVTTEDIIWAMNNVGLHNYGELLTHYLHNYHQENSMHYLWPNIMQPNAPSSQILPINSVPMMSYGYPHFPPNVLLNDPVASVMTNVRKENIVAKNDEDPDSSESSSS
ncbi:nuclear transcription factor Y subunit B-9 [Capsicum annuum]|nr:nuclear transcription factor Y subunit B-9 [Capsicum annuum]